jgi:hypothetical protein
LRRLSIPSSPSAPANSQMALGIGVGPISNGVGVPPGVPVTNSAPSVVPNENVTAVMVAKAVGSSRLIRKLAVWLRNGLCGSLPAIEPLALLYVPLAPGGPIRRCEGLVGCPSASKCRVDVPVALRPQPVATKPPSVAVPLSATVTSRPILNPSVAPIADAPVNEKLMSLSNCPTDVGFASKSASVTEIDPGFVMKVAEALTVPSFTVLPAGVLKTTVAAPAGDTVSTERHMTAALTAPVMSSSSRRGEGGAAKLADENSNAERWSRCGIGRTPVTGVVP